MFARLTRFEIPTDRIDQDIKESREAVASALKGMPGSEGSYYLVDREHGETVAITLWSDEAAMRASEEAAEKLRQEGASNNQGKVLSVERFEVAIQPSDVMASAR